MPITLLVLTVNWSIQKTVLLLSSFGFFLFVTPLFAEDSAEPLLELIPFLKRKPLKQNEVNFSDTTFKTIRFLKNGKIEIELSGKIQKTNHELHLDGEKISGDQGLFNSILTLNPNKENHSLKIKRLGISETEYPFRVQFIKDIPSPLRVRIKLANSKIVTKEQVFTGNYSSKEWLRFAWLKEKETSLEQRPSERELSMEAEKIQEIPATVNSREPFGLQIDQGVGLFSLKQSGKGVRNADLNSSNWISNIKIRRKFTETYFWEASGTTFLMPLSVKGAQIGPRLVKLEGGIGGAYPISENMVFLPALGFHYQTLSTPEDLGYRNIMGLKVTLAQDYHFENHQTLHTALNGTIFGNESNQFTSVNREFGARVALEWPLNSDLFNSFYLGGEWQTQSLMLNGIKLTSSVYSGFLGVLF